MRRLHPMPALQRCRAGFASAASGLLLAAALFWNANPAQAQPVAPAASRPASPSSAASPKPRGPASKASPASTPVAIKPTETKPTWAGLSEAHKRKWLALSQNFPKLPRPSRPRCTAG